ncbi:patatin-like phospholipase family protein [Microbacterium trichothecenolyticum]|uniref:Patatin-like phospholipase n=1 Tax=Microbacterium trichothecenolyticum TaxID=69370 RepID=A0A0M2HK66_MICTR|nr:patatin-like phospholipase family protein [Microbacterium trichothecenolyticum]KJL44736.1 Patatin-like phospholipase [Microbacterium trichothecenolyticum]
MNSATSAHPDPRRALVLGGGGSAGNAWLIGVIAGLSEAGLDVTDADLIVGTSAGSTAAAQVTSTAPAELFAATIAPVIQGPAGPRPRPAGPSLQSRHLDRMKAIIAAASDADDWRRKMGRELETDAAAATSAQWRATVAARFPTALWPRQRIVVTAVDAHSGQPVAFDRDSGIDLVDAVAASCAGGFAYGIGDARYIDGGYRSNADNADLAAGHDRVLVLSPLGGRSFTPVEWGTHLATQVDLLRAQGSSVETVFPDAASLTAFGDNMMNPLTRPSAARAGYEQARTVADRLSEFWRVS